MPKSADVSRRIKFLNRVIIMMDDDDSRTCRIRSVYGSTVRLGTVSHRTVAVPYLGCQMAVRYGYGSTVP